MKSDSSYVVLYYSDGYTPLRKSFDDRGEAEAFFERIESDPWKGGATLIAETILRRSGE